MLIYPVSDAILSDFIEFAGAVNSINITSVDIVDAITGVGVLNNTVLILHPGFVETVTVSIVEPGSIAVADEVGKVEAVVVLEVRDESSHRRSIAGDESPIAGYTGSHLVSILCVIKILILSWFSVLPPHQPCVVFWVFEVETIGCKIPFHSSLRCRDLTVFCQGVFKSRVLIVVLLDGS